MTQVTSAECFKCGAPATDTFGGGYLCDGCRPDGDGTARDDDLNQHSAGEDGKALVNDDEASADAPGDALEAFGVAVSWYHNQLDATLPDGRTAREYLREERGWTDDVIDENQIGYAPPTSYNPLDTLTRAGFDRSAILETGLFWDGLDAVWCGRFVLPYHDEEGAPVFAISRRLDYSDPETGGDVEGHPADTAGDYGDGAAKYHKIAVSREEVAVEEPIFGLSSVREGEPVLITEGIADAITAHQYGYPCVSPVTTRFKHADREKLVDALEAYDVPRVYVVQDAERTTSDVRDGADGWDALAVEQFGEGLRGAVDTAAHLSDAGVEAFVGELPRLGLDKVDLDDYLHGWATDGDLSAVLASSKPGTEHPAFNAKAAALESTAVEQLEARERADRRSALKPTGNGSALYDLDVFDVSGLAPSYRGENPLGHHGDSENYFAFFEEGGESFAFDHKYKATYTPLTYLLAAAGERSAESPNGRLSDADHLAAWRYAKEECHIPDDDPIPYAALLSVVREHGLADAEEIPSSRDESLPATAYNAALDVVRDKYDVDPGRDHVEVGSGPQQAETLVETSPPSDATHGDGDLSADEAASILEANWRALRGERLDHWIAEDRPMLMIDPAGTGKTFNISHGLDARQRKATLFFPTHRKTAEHVHDDETPDVDLHLRAAYQPAGDCLHDAVTGDECDEHGDPSNCPRMHPIYDLDPDHPDRERFHRLETELQTKKATFRLAEMVRDHLRPSLGEDDVDDILWLRQFSAIDGADTIAAPQEYATMSTVTDERDVVFDENIALESERNLSTSDLLQMADGLEGVAESQPPHIESTLREFAEFARALAGAVANEQNLDAEGLNGILSADGTAVRQSVGDGTGRYQEQYSVAEALAEAKVAFIETCVNRFVDGRGDLPPLAFDALLAAGVETGDLLREEAMRAVALDVPVDRCPHCNGALSEQEGARFCVSDGGCGWTEHDAWTVHPDQRPSDDLIGDPFDECDRMSASIPRVSGDDEPTLRSTETPMPRDLPDDPLVLDATGDETGEEVAAMFGVPIDDVHVDCGDRLDEVVDAGMYVEQVIDGQYHDSTVRRSERVQGGFQQATDTAGEIADEPLVTGMKDRLREFELPENAVPHHYGGARGVNLTQCDAVVALGAPHPSIPDLRERAERLAMFRDDIDAGGVEYSTRPENPNPPAYRKYRYISDDGTGRAAATKAFTGLTGTLFKGAREAEIVQQIHRARPALAAAEGEQVPIYLLSNVPTELQVDRLVTLDELTAPLADCLPLPERALELADVLLDVADGCGPDGFRAESLVERTDDGAVVFKKKQVARLARIAGITGPSGRPLSLATVNDHVNRLCRLGILDAGAYEQREGVSYAAEFATLERLSQVISCDATFQVALKRRLAALAGEPYGGLRWLRWAREAFDLERGSSAAGSTDPPPG